MTDTARNLLSAALSLPADERLELASELIASVDGPASDGWTVTWLAELDRRLRDADAHPESLADWDEVRARLLDRLARR